MNHKRSKAAKPISQRFRRKAQWKKKNLHVEEGALKVTKLTLYEAVAIIVGANVGSGILGLAYSSRLAGWPILVLWLAVAGLFTTFSMLYVAESALRTKKPLQLPGLAEKICR